jgi:prevent-host-death family protein
VRNAELRASIRHVRGRVPRARPLKVDICTNFALALFLLFPESMAISTKSMPIPVAHARKNFSDVIAQAREGHRIKLTRHGRNVAWVIGAADREALSTRGKRHKRSSKP